MEPVLRGQGLGFVSRAKRVHDSRTHRTHSDAFPGHFPRTRAYEQFQEHVSADAPMRPVGPGQTVRTIPGEALMGSRDAVELDDLQVLTPAEASAFIARCGYQYTTHALREAALRGDLPIAVLTPSGRRLFMVKDLRALVRRLAALRS